MVSDNRLEWDKYAVNEYAQPDGCVRGNTCMLLGDHKPQCGVTDTHKPRTIVKFLLKWV